ncbi:MAG: DNA gyrase inhibitor YacG [Pseudomonadota bacterium]|nr:DNA gyrase inhibitor YacG [Pseudomonadota bacterium]
MPRLHIVACPHCAKPVEWTPQSRWRPFCSERCKLIDLGAWASEAYRIPAEPVDPDDLPAPKTGEED